MVIVELTQTCGACPSEWEGNLSDGRRIYIRFRWGYLKVNISKNASSKTIDALYGEQFYSKFVGKSEFDGVIELETVLQLTGLTLSPDCEGQF